MSKLRLPVACILLLIAALSLSACSSPEYRDGVYTAEQQEFASSGWKDTMEITVEGGEIVKINWDAVYKDDSIPIRKKQYSKSGLYGMLKAGAVDEWYDQAIATEQFTLANGIDALQIKEGGYTDAIAGCSIHIDGFESLLRECMEKARIK